MLVRLKHGGQEIDAVVQLTKTGLEFVFDRGTGASLFPIEERPVPAYSELPGEWIAPTQPFPVKPAPLVPQRLTEADLWDRHPNLERCRKQLAGLRNQGIFTPPSEGGALICPGLLGGANWSGGAFDPESGYLYVPTNNVAVTVRLKKLPEENFEHTGDIILRSAFRALRWVLTGTGTGLRYHMIDRRLFAVGDIPCNRPPWGTLSAVDLNRGEIVWQVPVGYTKEGIAGTMNFGPPLVTAGGLVFHGGGSEAKLRAHDAKTGELLMSFDLPAGLHSGPIAYKVRPDGKRYLVVAPGGYTGLSKLGDYVIAYTLSE
jgi:quinoprotein glucose dehydrogenase